MKKAASDYPLVSITQRGIGQAYQLSFRRDGEQIKKGTGTTDYATAQEYARKLSTILVGELFNNAPQGTPDIVLGMLGITPRAEKAREFANKSFEKFIRKFIGDDDFDAVSTDNDLLKFKKAVEAIINERESLKVELQATNTERDSLKAEVRALTERVEAYNALQWREGKAAVRALDSKTLREAIEFYLADGTTASSRSKKDVKNMLYAFAEVVGDSVKIHELDDVKVLDCVRANAGYVKKKDEWVKDTKEDAVGLSTLRKISLYICAMLEKASRGTYPLESIKAFMEARTQHQRLVNAAYGLTPAEIALLWKTAPLGCRFRRQTRERDGHHWNGHRFAAVGSAVVFDSASKPEITSNNSSSIPL